MASNTTLPSAARLVLRLLVSSDVREEVEGDLAERYSEIREEIGLPAAARWLLWQLLALRPGTLRRPVGSRPDSVTGTASATGGLGGDLRLGLRALRLRPGPSLVVIATVALSVGATTSVFSVVDGVLLRPLPYPEADRLVRVWQTKESWFDSPNAQLQAFANRFPLSVPTFQDWTRADIGFTSLGAYRHAQYVHRGADGSEVLSGQGITSGFFETLGIEPVLGRTLQPEDDAIGAPPVAVLAEGWWQSRFGGDPGVLGTSLSLDGVTHTVVGVVPSSIQGPEAGVLVWTQLSEEEKQDERGSQYLSVVARLDGGVSMDLATQRLATVQDGLREAYPDDQGDVGARMEGLMDSIVGDVRSTLWFLLGAVGLVLVVATLNIANILTVSGLQRRREMAVRSALGAGSGRLMRGLFVESAVLASAGGLAGVCLALVSLPVLVRLIPSSVPRYELIGVRPSVLAFGLGVTALTTLIVGTFPALQAAAARPMEMMRGSARGSTDSRGGRRIRSGIVVAEVSLAFVLLVAAGLLGNSFARLWNVDRGFEAEGLVLLSAEPDPAEYPEPEDGRRFSRELRDRLEAIPGVEVSATSQVPLSGSSSTTTYYLEREGGEDEEMSVLISVGLENYLDVMKIPVVEGRRFTLADDEDAPLVGIVNQAMVDAAWPGESALGKRLRSREDWPWVEVVGVTANVRHLGLAQDVEPKLYLPAAQSRRSTDDWVLRAQGDLQGVIGLARDAVSAQSPATPVRNVSVLEETIHRSVAVYRFRTYFMVGLAGLAGLLALLGVYGVVTFSVAQRSREIGVRMALGANADGVLRSVLGSGVRLALAGVAGGLIVAWPTMAVIADFLYGIEPTDPATFAAIALGVTAVSALAAYLPARRAATVDPVTVLNSE